MKKTLNQLTVKLFLTLFAVCGQTVSVFGYGDSSAPTVTQDTMITRGLFGPNVDFRLSGKFKPESFYGNGVKLLNNDQIIFSRHTLDLNFDFSYGQHTYGEKVAEFYFDLRNKTIWGNADSVATTGFAKTKILESVGRDHKHPFPRNVFWMRKAWLEFDIGAAFNTCFFDKHTFKIGAFSFELGRGISLGSAYAVGPEPLGFYTPDAVDQYAFGAKMSGDIVGNLSYDLYAAILDNKSDTFSNTEEKVFGQEYGRLKTPERGFGHINYIFAGRLKFDVCSDSYGTAHVEPYVLYNNDPENRIEFTADAQSKLTTLGIAAEFVGDTFEFGFDIACNLGHQSVRGWDTNTIIEQNRGGLAAVVNSKVKAVTLDQNGMIVEDFGNVPYVDKSAAQNLIDAAYRSEGQNGKTIGTISDFPVISSRAITSTSTIAGGDAHTHDATFTLLDATQDRQIILQNASDRFRDPYENKFKGWMFVTDASAHVSDDFTIAGAFGVASGDDNPNTETKDYDYKGFIPLQEVYEGKRVKSAFLLGGAGKVRRLLSTQGINKDQTKLGGVVSSFTNIIYTGGGLTYKPIDSCRNLMINTNVLTYWQEYRIIDFDKHLGTEVNVFLHWNLLDDLKFFGVGSVFVPGTHYDDIKGRLISIQKDAILDMPDKTGFTKDQLPSYGNSVAWTINLGLEYTF